MNSRLALTTLFLAALAAPAAECRGEETFRKNIDTFLDRHCYECHDDLSTKGGLDLYALPTDLSDPATLEKWIRIYDRVEAGEMPPEDRESPAFGEVRNFGEALAPSLAAAHEAEKGTVLRRLNRKEYENTLNDLLGLRLAVVDDLPEDGQSHGFDTVGEALGMSMIQLQSYLDVAALALDEAIAKSVSNPEPKRIVTNYTETREAQKHLGSAWLKAPDGAVVFFREIGYPSGMLRTANTGKPGLYRIKVTGYAYQSDRPVTFAVGGTSFARGSEKPIFGYFTLPPGKPSSIELTAWMDERYMIEITPKGIYDHENVIREKGIASYEGPGLAITEVELEGPLVDEFPSRGHKLIFEGLDRSEIEPGNPADKKKSWYTPRFEITTEPSAETVAPVLKRFASAAFRRPATDEDIAAYLILFQGEMTKGATFEEALRTALSGILCSPNFLFLREPEGKLDDHALASRLSYFLTRTLPDEQLLAAAAGGRLGSDPGALRAEAVRLLEGDRLDRFVKDFTDAWLDLRSIEFTNPDSRLFPEFDRYLQDSMLAETRGFFRILLEENLGIEHVVKSDFTLLNTRLAEHYGVGGVTAPAVERVSLPADSPRGGFLSHASVLKVSANGTNTSPVLRGVWINERILGNQPPPPPPGVPGVEPDIRGAETLREILDRHRDSENCKACHVMIDPPGFALESFNPIGGWRERFRSLGEGEKPDIQRAGNNFVRYRIGPPVDASGALPDGTAFSGFREYRDHIAADRDRLAKNLLEKLLVFGTGRELGFSDRPEIERLVAESAKRGHGVRDLVLLAITSDIFLHK